MKKLILICAMSVIAGSICLAQNTTRIGENHSTNFGVYYGFGNNGYGSVAGGFIDINARKSNFRTRLNFEIVQITEAFCPAASVDFQYLAKLSDCVCFYPYAGIEAEYHKASDWAKTFDLGPQAGIGFEFQFTGNFGLFLQGGYRYNVLSKMSVIGGQAGLVFAFGPGRHSAQPGRSAAKAEEAKLAAQKAESAEAAANAETKRIEAEKAAEAKKIAEQKAEADKLAAKKAMEDKAAAEAAKRVSVHNVQFATGSTFINEAGRVSINEAIRILSEDAGAVVEIKAFAQKESDTSEGNMKLSLKRAEAVKSFFIEAGIPESSIDVKAYGDTISLYDTPEANRLVVIMTK